MSTINDLKAEYDAAMAAYDRREPGSWTRANNASEAYHDAVHIAEHGTVAKGISDADCRRMQIKAEEAWRAAAARRATRKAGL